MIAERRVVDDRVFVFLHRRVVRECALRRGNSVASCQFRVISRRSSVISRECPSRWSDQVIRDP